MLKTVLLITPGRFHDDPFGEGSETERINLHKLKPEGVDDARWLGMNVNKSCATPRIIFSTNEEMCVHTALIMTGVVDSVKHTTPPLIGEPLCKIGSFRISKKSDEFHKSRRDFWKNFREAFKTSEGIRSYLGSSFMISNNVEQIAIVSTPAFGGVFNECKSGRGGRSYPFWGIPTIYKFDINKQSLDQLVEYDGRFGYV